MSESGTLIFDAIVSLLVALSTDRVILSPAAISKMSACEVAVIVSFPIVMLAKVVGITSSASEMVASWPPVMAIPLPAVSE